MTLLGWAPADSDNDLDPEPTGRLRRGLRSGWRAALPAALVLILLIVAAGVFLSTGGGGSTKAAPIPPAVTAPQQQTQPSHPSPAATDQTVPVSTPAGLTWQKFGGVLVPYSTTAGPSYTDGPVVAGYAHTPLGALIAAQQIIVRSFVTPGDGWRAVTEKQIVDGPGKTAWEQMRAQVDPTAPAGGFGQPVGFRFVTYTPGVAVIDLVVTFDNGSMIGDTVTVQWVNGDWRLQLQVDGADSPNDWTVTSLADYTPWGAL